ncbi:3-oxoacyl-[acyl-carrier-protein] synthase, KASIII [Serinicoccus hydrothermalis]|uniref:Beta-ketoacyl-[acyl-carrier-protein] synthase III n=1 Tax=Serinicoccus hydrothermalis TaxID=1758689 RepID=A0A1B1N7X0_9MICO|nr:beta-ketoacyl-ACP synthase III [Serinicoccus hydrothermalis]ANS77511.1 3-oxoacyl-[acyl-carrier-protein] synthase, KASIII [Serinicoccus hydrothermalis]
MSTSPTLSAPTTLRHARILGLGGYRPERVVTNEEVLQFIDSSDEWIRQRSGIATRRFAREDESVVDMAEAASRQALERAGLEPGQVDAVLMATVTHPLQTPAAAPVLAHRLGIEDPAAFDLSAACAGYCYAISLANDMVRAGTADTVLVVGVEKLSDFTDKHDRGSAFIFGDGAGAAVVGVSDTPGIGPTVWGSLGDRADAITQRESWTDLRPEMEATGREAGIAWPAFTMQGQTVFRWAVFSMAPVALQAVEAAGITPADLAAFVPHQANMRITDAMVKALDLPPHVPVARDIAETGNTSAASIPLAMSRMLDEGEAPHGGLALQIGFGAGLVYAAQVVEMP